MKRWVLSWFLDVLKNVSFLSLMGSEFHREGRPRERAVSQGVMREGYSEKVCVFITVNFIV